MAELYTARPDPNIFAFVNTQLLSVLWHNLDETWLAGEWWPGPVRFLVLNVSMLFNADYTVSQMT